MSYKVISGYLILSFLVLGCQNQPSRTQYLIGFSQCVSDDQWRQSMHKGMERELQFYPELSLEIKNAGGSSNLQIQHVREFIKQGVDLLIVSPNEAEPITPIVEEAYRNGLPIIVIDRRTSSNEYTAFIGANNYKIGYAAGDYSRALAPTGSKIIEIWGLEGSTPAIDRHEGFIDCLKDEFEVVQVHSNWTKDDAKNKFEKVINENLDAKIIYAHNDIMALGAYEVCKKMGVEKRIKFIGIDGLPGPTGGMQMVMDGILNATLLYPTGGEEAIRLAASILRGQPYEKENILQTTLIKNKNVRILKLQSDKILNQQNDIQRQQKRYSEQLKLYDNQRTLIYVLIGSLLITFLLGAYIFYSLREKQEINKRLEATNREIEEQRNEILKISKEAEEANTAKLKFFTNISHEFRTPLTLILGPVEELLEDKKNISSKLRIDLQLIQKNAYRLLRLINQLMEFRKIENGKMQVKASENDLIEFVKEIKTSFNGLATEKSVELGLASNKDSIILWFDINMIDKVLFNLLSNAFKFIPPNGYILIEITDKEESVLISIRDSGRGMSDEHARHAFDRFYCGDQYKSRGTGLGLSLAKELIDLHKGNISLESNKGSGTTFLIELKKGRDHFKNNEIIESVDDLRVEASEYIKQHAEISFSANASSKDHDVKILIIEDNKDLIQFLQNHLSQSYDIIVAEDGNKGLVLAQENVPDLIICDVMMPGMDGFEITKRIKGDFRTSHIPIIMLTARSSDEQKVIGMQAGADQYITKPFNINYLTESIKTRIKNRELLMRHFNVAEDEERVELPINLDQVFIRKFKDLIESHLNDSNLNVDLLSKELGISRVQLYRKVNALIGKNPSDYISDLRLSKAKKLLQSDLAISEVAYQTGFSSPAYFSTAFKNRYNLSPKDFRSKKLS